MERGLRFLVLKTDWLCQTRSLWSSNRKFQPDWLLRSLVYVGSLTSPRVALFYIIAEGFVRIPGFGPLLVAQPANRADRRPAIWTASRGRCMCELESHPRMSLDLPRVSSLSMQGT